MKEGFGEGSSPMDIFDMFFGGGRRQRDRDTRTKTLVQSLKVIVLK